MKTIKVRHFFRMPFLMKLLIAVALPICFCFLIVGIVEHIVELILIGAIPLVSAIVGFGFFFSYGIKITSKRVKRRHQYGKNMELFYSTRSQYVA